MKYLSLIIFVVLLAWTWNLIHREPVISFETHAGIQEKLAQLIQQTVLTKKPEATDIRIQKIWTEPQGEDKVQAHFIYSFQEPDTNGKTLTNQITADGILEKQKDDGSGLERWSLTKVQTTNDAVTFEEGLYVTPGEDPAPTEGAPVTPPPHESH